MKILSLIFIVCNFVVLPRALAWEGFLQMLAESEKATATDFKKLKSIYTTREEVVIALSSISPAASSYFYEKYREAALKLISYHTEFNGHGSKPIPPWKQIAEISLGTDDLEKAVVGFVALGDIRGLPSFQKILVDLHPTESSEASIDFLSSQFTRMKLSV